MQYLMVYLARWLHVNATEPRRWQGRNVEAAAVTEKLGDSLCDVLELLTGKRCMNLIVSFGRIELFGVQLDVGPVRLNVLGFGRSVARTVTLLTVVRMLEEAPFMFPNDACGTANRELLEHALQPLKVCCHCTSCLFLGARPDSSGNGRNARCSSMRALR
jgi:hypothetical protein